MKRAGVVGAMLLLGLAAAAPARAQEPEDSAAAAADTSLAVRRLDYQSARVVPGAAAVVEYFVPEVGYVYAHAWKKGLAPTAVTLAGAWLFLSGLGAGWDCGPTREQACGSAGVPVAGAVMLIAGRVWGIAGALSAAKSYNRRLRTRLRLEAAARGGRVQVGLVVPAP